MENYPKPISKRCIQQILYQMNNSIFKISEKEIGFFCSIKYENKNIPVMVINNYLLDEKYNESIDISINNTKKALKLGKTRYTNKEYNISIIEIKEDENYNINYLEIDDNLYEKYLEICYHNETIYIVHKKNEDDNSVSFGLINNIDESYLKYSCNLNSNQNGCPILNSSNNKLIGIHINRSNYYNKGIIMKNVINEFINKYKWNQNTINEIDITIKIDKKDINKEVYFLDNNKSLEFLDKFYFYHSKILGNLAEPETFQEHLSELNKLNSKIYVKNIDYGYQKYLIPKREGIFNIHLKFNTNLTNCSYMFAGCKNIININFRYFNTEYISDMKYMFCGCKNLKSINLYSFNTNNVTDMSYMFSGRENLKSLDLYSFDTNNVTDMSYMFYRCINLNNINLTSVHTSKVKDMTYMFGGCENLISLDLSSSFDINNINKIKYMFVSCDKLKYITSSLFVTNEIDILINVRNNDINKEIYFLDNYEGSSKNKHLYELNNINTKSQIS